MKQILYAEKGEKSIFVDSVFITEAATLIMSICLQQLQIKEQPRQLKS